MLKQRIVTAIILLPIMLGMLFSASNGTWAIFSGAIAIATLAEYSNMSGINAKERSIYCLGTAIFFLLALLGDWKLPSLAWLIALFFWFILMPLWLKKKWTLRGNWQAYVVGWVIVIPFWFALVQLRAGGQASVSLFSIMCLVWVADIAAYFCGKTFGQNKIAPTISPGKSWEGAIGGAVCVMIYMTIARAAAWLNFDTSWITTMLISLVLTAVSIGGDLLESWFKRSAGMKDSGHVLPGHGGVFDRVDALIPVVVVYAGIQILFS